MAQKRKALSKKIRFEVFKRDSFKCQYCGGSAPDVLLEIDHIKPISKGGSNRITNLITACKSCNRGKSNKKLDDNSLATKQRKQAEELNERREQLKMMLKWQEELLDMEEDKANFVIALIEKRTNSTLTQSGRALISTTTRQFPFDLVVESTKTSMEQYLIESPRGGYLRDSVDKAVTYIPKICRMTEIHKEKPYLKELFYIRGIYNNRLGPEENYNKRQLLCYLEDAYLKGVSIQELQDAAETAFNYSDFRQMVDDCIEGG